MVEQEGPMITSNGLRIYRIDLEEGGFRVELHKPSGNNTAAGQFAVISREQDGIWRGTVEQIRATSLPEAVLPVDAAYARHRQRVDAKAKEAQQRRERLNAEVAEEWQAVVALFRDDASTEQ